MSSGRMRPGSAFHSPSRFQGLVPAAELNSPIIQGPNHLREFFLDATEFGDLRGRAAVSAPSADFCQPFGISSGFGSLISPSLPAALLDEEPAAVWLPRHP